VTLGKEVKETVSATVSVEFLGLKKHSRIVNNSSAPMWDDEIYFKLDPNHMHRQKRANPSEKFEEWRDVLQNSIIHINLWDHDNNMTSPLGYTSVKMRRVFYGREPAKIISFASGGRKANRYILRKIDPLQTHFALSIGEDPDAAMVKRMEDETHPTRTLNHLKESLSRYIEYYVYLEKSDGEVFPLEVETRSGKTRKTGGVDTKYLQSQNIVRAHNYWKTSLRFVPNREARCFPFFGKDLFTGSFHYLPRFLSKMLPPIAVQSKHRLMYFIYCLEFHKHDPVPAIETTFKPVESAKGSLDPIVIPTWVWSHPYFFLDRRRGGHTDHAILLCSFLLGLNMDAYVAIGTVKTDTNEDSPGKPHVWVVTRERASEYKARQTLHDRVMDKVRSMKDKGSHSKEEDSTTQTEESTRVSKEEDDDPSNDSAEDEKLGHKNEKPRHIIRFWEASNGRTYVLDNVFDPDQEGQAKKEQEEQEQKEEKQAREEMEKKQKEQEENVKHDTKHEGQYASQTRRVDDSDEDMEDDLEFLGLSLDLVPNETDTKISSAADQPVVATIQQARQQELRRRQQTEMLAVAKLETMKEKKQLQVLPYKSIDTVFNNTRLLANLQNEDPRTITYHFDDASRWQNFGDQAQREIMGLPHLEPFYKETQLAATVLGVHTINHLATTLTARLKDAIVGHRSYTYQEDTVWAEHFEFQKKILKKAQSNADGGSSKRQIRQNSVRAYMQQRLELEEELGYATFCDNLTAMDSVFQRHKRGREEESISGKSESRKVLKTDEIGDIPSCYYISSIRTRIVSRIS
jgi:hypothetical protein